jgi:hypothetical protein
MLENVHEFFRRVKSQSSRPPASAATSSISLPCILSNLYAVPRNFYAAPTLVGTALVHVLLPNTDVLFCCFVGKRDVAAMSAAVFEARLSLQCPVKIDVPSLLWPCLNCL